MRKYGRRTHRGQHGGLVLKKYVEYVHDCATECPNGHPMWSNVTLRAESLRVWDWSIGAWRDATREDLPIDKAVLY